MIRIVVMIDIDVVDILMGCVDSTHHNYVYYNYLCCAAPSFFFFVKQMVTTRGAKNHEATVAKFAIGSCFG